MIAIMKENYRDFFPNAPIQFQTLSAMPGIIKSKVKREGVPNKLVCLEPSNIIIVLEKRLATPRLNAPQIRYAKSCKNWKYMISECKRIIKENE